jgi:DNA-binding transcriptional LysR family regulator
MRISYIDEFLELYKTLNYNQAAKNLFIGQATLSKHIKALEDDLGTQLFNRDKYYIEATSQGTEFVTYATQISKLYKAAQDLYANESITRGRFLVGGLVDSRQELNWLSTAAAEVRKRYPDFNPMFIPSGINSPLGELSSGNLDCVVFSVFDENYEKPEKDPISKIFLKNEPIAALVNLHDSLAKKEVLHAEDLKRVTFIQMVGPRMQSGWRAVEHFLEGLHIEYSIRQVPIMSIFDYGGIQVREGEVLLLPQCEIEPDGFSSNPLRAQTKTLSIDEKFAYLPFSLIYRTDTSPAYIKEFAEELKRVTL